MQTSLRLASIPSAKGAYVLDLHVTRDFSWQSRARKCLTFSKGRYLYCGSARANGGLHARIKRHCRRDKKPHWHVDPLTVQFGVHDLYFDTDQSECELVARLLELSTAHIPFKGFGSSDCPVCESHLVALQTAQPLSEIFGGQPLIRIKFLS